MEEKVTDLRLNSEVGKLNPTGKENIAIDISDGNLTLKINSNKIFSSLKERKTIIAYLNKKLDELLDKHLSGMEEKERERNKDL